MILNDPHNSHHNQDKENAYVGQECNVISYNIKVQDKTGHYKTFQIKKQMEEKEFDSKTLY